jgi:hypothetical protein
MDLNRQRPSLTRIEGNLLFLGFLGLIVILGVAIYASWKADLGYCNAYALKRASDPYELVVIGIGGLVAGRVLGHGRRWIHREPLPLHEQIRTPPWLQGLLALLLIVSGGALLYEGFGLGHYLSAPPITSYIRCASDGQVGLTAIVTTAVFLLLGGWLWHPTNSRSAIWVTLMAALVWGALAVGVIISTNNSLVAITPDSRGYSHVGFTLVSLVILAFPIVTMVADLRLTHQRGLTVGHYVNGFVVAYPWFGFVLSIVVGAMLAHFFLGLVGQKAVVDFIARLLGGT